VSEARARTVPARVHGRYLIQVPPGAGPFPLVVGFHGYGERAEQHLEQLRRLPGADVMTLVAVQSLHLFYTKAGEVVGSWMTRLEREHAIADNVAYVRAVVEDARREAPAAGPLVFIGFSQGASMAWRAAAHSGQRAAAVIALGGDMPPDVADDAQAALPPALIARGQRDEWFTDAKMQKDLHRCAARGVSARSLVFDGGHEWSEAFFGAAGEFLAATLDTR
jgi:predicted esterase